MRQTILHKEIDRKSFALYSLLSLLIWAFLAIVVQRVVSKLYFSESIFVSKIVITMLCVGGYVTQQGLLLLQRMNNTNVVSPLHYVRWYIVAWIAVVLLIIFLTVTSLGLFMEYPYRFLIIQLVFALFALVAFSYPSKDTALVQSPPGLPHQTVIWSFIIVAGFVILIFLMNSPGPLPPGAYYLRDGSYYLKDGTHVIRSDNSHMRRNRSGFSGGFGP